MADQRVSRTFRIASLIIALALVALSCSSSTVTETAAEPTAAPEPTAVPEPTAAPEPTAVPEPTAEPTPVPEPTETPESADDSEETEEPEETEESAAMVVPDPIAITTLIDAGEEPRVLLRYELDPACTEMVTMEQIQELSQVMGENELPSAGPAGSIMSMRITNSAVEDGIYAVASEVISAEPAPGMSEEVADLMARELAAIVGMKSSNEITSQGVPVPGTATLEGVEDLDSMVGLLESLNGQLANPMPTEPVGVGASWESLNTVELQGLQVTTRSIQTITEISDLVVTVEISGDQSVPNDSVMSLPGIEAKVLEWDTTFSGTAQFDLESLSPVRSEANTISLQSFEVGPGLTLDQSMTMQMTVTGERGSGCS